MEELQITTPERIEDHYINFESLKTGQLFYFDDFSSNFCMLNIVKDNTLYFNVYSFSDGRLIGNNYQQIIKNSLQTEISLIEDNSIVKKYTDLKELQDNVESFQDVILNNYRLRREKIEGFKSLGVRKALEDVIKHHFTSDNYEINIDYESLKIILKYNDITITNSEGNSHFIKSMFVRIVYNLVSNKFINSLYGKAGELSVKELNCGYVHSHMPGNVSDWGKFCLGSSEITGILADLSINEFNDAKFDLLLYNLEEYIKWESLEGGPHFKIKDLNYGSNNILCITDESISEVHKSFIRNTSKFNTMFDYSINKIKINIDDLLITNILDVCPNQYRGMYINDTFIKNLNYDQLISIAEDKLDSKDQFKFKDKIYPIMYVEEGLEEEEKLVPHNDIVNGVIEKLENQINNHFLINLK
jgi:predicted CopG family antitoxin